MISMNASKSSTAALTLSATILLLGSCAIAQPSAPFRVGWSVKDAIMEQYKKVFSEQVIKTSHEKIYLNLKEGTIHPLTLTLIVKDRNTNRLRTLPNETTKAMNYNPITGELTIAE